MSLKFFRKLGEVWAFDLTWIDRTEQPQSIAAATGLAANWYTMDDVAVSGATNDTTGCTIVEIDASTIGQFRYKRTDLSQFAKGVSYKLEFVASINGELTKTPEKAYIVVEVN